MKAIAASIALSLMLAQAAPAQAAADPDFQKVYGCMRANVPETLRGQEIQFDSIDRTGATRTLRGKLLGKRENGLSRFVIRITAPANVAGASYLLLERGAKAEDDMFVYLPGVGRVRHVTGAFANGSLLGTDFSYADAKLIQSTFMGADGKLEAPSEIEQRPVHVVTLTPGKKTKSPAYTLVRLWLDQKTCVPLKADFYTGDQQLRKELTASPSALRQSGKYSYLSEVQMRDLKEGTKTVMKFGNIEGDVKATPTMFDPNSFFQGN